MLFTTGNQFFENEVLEMGNRILLRSFSLVSVGWSLLCGLSCGGPAGSLGTGTGDTPVLQPDQAGDAPSTLTTDPIWQNRPSQETTAGPAPRPSPSPLSSPVGRESPSLVSSTWGARCAGTGDSSQICLGLRYIVYQDSSGTPLVQAMQAIQNISEINGYWSSCKIAFQLDDLQWVTPAQFGLNYSPANLSELSEIRNAFLTSDKILVVTTGPWNRSGTLGSSGANAWTSMPGYNPLGVVLESTVGTYSQIIAHELGHYLNLDHASSANNVMSALIYPDSVELSTTQCSEARNAALSYFTKALR
jgi:hypothetical protein